MLEMKRATLIALISFVAATAFAQNGAWQVKRENREFTATLHSTNVKMAYIEIAGEEPDGMGWPNPKPIFLHIYIGGGGARLSSYRNRSPISLSFDNGKPEETQWWIDSQSNEATSSRTFNHQGKKHVFDLIKSSKTLAITYWTDTASGKREKVTAIYNLEGISNVLTEQCREDGCQVR